METKDARSEIRPDIFADLQATCRQAGTGGPKGPELARRIQKRSKKAGQEILAKFGVQEIEVQIIREMRDGEHRDGDCPSHQRSSSRLQNGCV